MTVEFDLGGASAPATPRDAATVIVLRDRPLGPPEIFFVKRNAGVRFMGGAMVFPGGKLDAGDASEVPGDLTDTVCATRLGEDDAVRARALHVAALRECLEESGLLFATDPVSAAVCAGLRAQLAPRNAPPIGPMLHEAGVTLALSALVPVARWVTPKAETRRFDARFFAAVVDPSSEVAASHDGSETVDSVWLTAEEALARAEKSEIVLAPPTWRTVAALRALSRADALASLPHAIPPAIEPTVEVHGDTLYVVLPEAMPANPFGDTDALLPGCFAYADGVWRPLS